MSGKLSRKERAQQQKAKQATATSSQPTQQKKKPVSSVPRANSVVRGLTVILIALSVIVYFNSLYNEYALDDYSLILENSQTKKGAKAFFEILGSSYREGYMGGDNTLYRPLSKAMFAVEWSATEGPGINHFFNVALFTLSVVLLFKMLRLYMRGNVLVPFLTAAIFAAHPIHTEVVANIKGRDDILCFLFFVVSAIYVYRYQLSKNIRHLAIAAFAFFLSFLSKESAITFAAVIPLMLYFFTDADKPTYMRVGGMVTGVTVLFLLIRFAVLHGGGSSPVPVVDNYIAGIDGFLAQRITAIAIGGIYLLKLFVPYELVCDASVSQIPVYHFGDWQFLVPFVIFLGAFAYAVMTFKKKNPVSFGILYFFITFSMVSNIPFILGTNYGERLLYAPSLGICFIVAFFIAKFLQREESVTGNVGDFFRMNKNAVLAALAIVAVYSVLTINRNPDWHDNLTLYSTDVQKSTNSSKLHYYFANHITQQEYLINYKPGTPERDSIIDTAMAEFKTAIALYPGYGDALQKLAEMYFEKGHNDSADYYYNVAIKQAPTNAMYHNNYGRMLFSTGRIDDSKAQFEEAIKYNAAYAHAYNNLAGAIGTQGAEFVRKGIADTARQHEYNQKAIEYYQKSVEYSLKAIACDPNFVQAYETASMTYANMGDQANAQKYAAIAQQLKQQGAK